MRSPRAQGDAAPPGRHVRPRHGRPGGGRRIRCGKFQIIQSKQQFLREGCNQHMLIVGKVAIVALVGALAVGVERSPQSRSGTREAEPRLNAAIAAAFTIESGENLRDHDIQQDRDLR